MIEWHIGCSGFHYPEWKKVFYPEDLPQKMWFHYYSQRFDTLELNVTFYRFPKPSFLQTWYKTSPSTFTFSVKAPRLITHYKQFSETERMLGDFYGNIRDGLQEKLGCVLFQLPERVSYSEERLEKIIRSMDSTFTNVLEFRHKSWWNDAVFDMLSRHSIVFCSQSHPQLPDDVIFNNRVVYYRFHGTPELYKSQYPKKKIHEIMDRVMLNEKTEKAFIYYNNTMGVAGIRNARQTVAYCKSLKT